MFDMKAEFIDLIVTSPPYGALRQYNGFSFDFISVASEIYRVIKAGGVLVWVVADEVINGSESGQSFKQALHFMSIGFRLHDTMIYMSKPKYPDPTRYGNCFEYMFVLSKGRPKTINLIKDRKNRWFESFGVQSERRKDGSLVKRKKIQFKEFGVRFNIWKIDNGYKNSSVDSVSFKHPATFPEELASGHIQTWTNPGDLIYDPFIGSGTTAKCAIMLDRRYIGSEISISYCEVAAARLQTYENKIF
jgi:DNA modification methylase